MNPTVIIPAAGLGTRLRPLTLDRSKEMLPVGGRPAIYGSLLELAAAGVRRAIVVVASRKQRLIDWIEANVPTGVSIEFVEQPEPRGIADAVARATASLDSDRYTVLYPDYVHLPEQAGLRALHAAVTTEPRATWFGLVRVDDDSAARMGRTACVHTEAVGGGRHKILSVQATPPRPGALHTAFAEVRGPTHVRLLDDERSNDEHILLTLERLAHADCLYGLELPGAVLDLGNMAGYRDACARFETGATRWREEGI